MRSPRAMFAGALAALAACSPALDWREVRPEGSDVALLFPCRPDRHDRPVPLAGQQLALHLVSCRADGIAFSLLFGDVADAGRVGPTLDALRAAAAANVGATRGTPFAHGVAGATPNTSSGGLRLQGALPDGTRADVAAVFFARGLRVYQASLLAPKPADSAIETFFAAIRIAAP